MLNTSEHSDDATWHEIDSYIAEVASLSRQDVSPTVFYTKLLDRTVGTLAAHAGVVWLRQHDGSFKLVYQIRLADTGLQNSVEAQHAHVELVQRCLQSTGIQVIPPSAGHTASGQAGNPTFLTLVVCPIVDGENRWGVIEVFLPADCDPATQRGCADLIQAVGDLAIDFHRNLDYRQLQNQKVLWRQLDEFTRQVHGSLDFRDTAFTIVNEGRQLIECDRVSVLVSKGSKQSLLAISGMDYFDRRSDVARRLTKLANLWSAADDAFWCHTGDADLPTPIRNIVETHVDEGDLRHLAIIPLRSSATTASNEPGELIGTLVIEAFQAVDEHELRQRTSIVARHATSALHRAREHSDLPLAGLLRLFGRALSFLHLRHLPKTTAVLLLIAAAIATLALVPADFDVEVRGELQPLHRRDVFAPSDGVVVDLKVEHGDQIDVDDVLAVLRNPELDLAEQRVLGEIQTDQQRKRSIEAMRLDEQAGNGDDDAGQLSAEAREIEVRLASLGKQREILARQKDELTVRSPMAGQMITWDAEKRLFSRPLVRGQIMMRVADLDGPWTAELWLPEDQAEHVLAAQRNSDEPLGVSFILKSNPALVHEGQITNISMAVEPHETEGQVALVTVEFDDREIAQPLPGAGVIADIGCGRKPIGYVWFHDILDAVRTYILF